jgi:dihydroorotase
MILFRRAQVFDGARFMPERLDVLISGGRVMTLGQDLVKPAGAQEIDLSGLILAPGFIDLHGHFRDPGQTWRETVLTGARAAAAGGFALAVAMPNTDPALDSAALIRYVLDQSRQAGAAFVLPAGCVSQGRQGKTLAELGAMAEEGAVLFTDDGAPVATANLLRQAMLYTRDLGVKIMDHPEEGSLTKGAQVHEGRASALSGLKGWPAAAEVLGVARGIALSRETDFPIHLTHLSTAQAVGEIRRAKAEGLPVTCDVTPHHLALSEEDVLKSGLGGVYKVNPPLRSPADAAALWDGLADGTVDAIATDHAPYHADEKDLPFQEASFGIPSYECAVAVVLTEWRARGRPGLLERLLAAWTSGPARVLPETLGQLGVVQEGAPAHLTVLDLDKTQTVAMEAWQSKARLGPYQGRSLTGWPVLTLVGGEVVFSTLPGVAAGEQAQPPGWTGPGPGRGAPDGRGLCFNVARALGGRGGPAGPVRHAPGRPGPGPAPAPAPGRGRRPGRQGRALDSEYRPGDRLAGPAAVGPRSPPSRSAGERLSRAKRPPARPRRGWHRGGSLALCLGRMEW